MLKNNYICALDIGASKIAAAAAEIKKGNITNIFFESLPSKGFKKGTIVDSILFVECLAKVLKSLKAKSGINIKYIYANISGEDISTKHSRAIIPLAERGNKVITLSDIQKVNDQARILGSSLEEEIIHQMPFSYNIDSGSKIINPVGLYSHRLESDLFLICAKLSSVQNITRCVAQAGYEIKKIFFSGLATASAVFNNELKNGATILCDIGSDITELLFFEDGLLHDVSALILGGDDLSHELAKELRITFDLAEDVKRSYGVIGDSNLINPEKEILIKKNSVYKPIKQRLVAEIISAKSKDISSSLKNCIENMIVPSRINNFIVTGRTILLEGFLEMLENNLGTSVKIGRISHPEIGALLIKENMLAGHNYLTYLTAVGMVSCALSENQARISPTGQPARNLLIQALNKFKEVYQEYF